MSGVPVVRRRTDWTKLQIGCAPIVAALVAVFVAVGLTLAGRSAPAPTAPPHTNETTTITAAINGSVAVGVDDRTIIYSGPDACLTPHLTADETAGRVTLTLTESDEYLGGCALATRRGIAQVRLPAPLGSREVVDAVSGRTVPHLSEKDLLRPQLPVADWISDPLGAVSTGMAYFGGPGAAVLVENFVAKGTLGRLAIVQVEGGGWHPPPGTLTKPVTVRGHPGVAGRGVIVWSESGHTVAVIGVRAVPPTTARPGGYRTEQPGTPYFDVPDQPLTTAELLAIAATLAGVSK